MNPRRATRQPRLALAATAGALTIVGTTLTVMHACVPAGGVARVGLGLALLQPDDGCPPGTFGLTAAGQALVVALTAPVLLVHLVLLAGAVGLLAAVRAVAIAVATRLRAHVPARTALPPLPAGGRVTPCASRSPLGRLLEARPYRRGPPALLGAR